MRVTDKVIPTVVIKGVQGGFVENEPFSITGEVQFGTCSDFDSPVEFDWTVPLLANMQQLTFP